jgi:PAS domain S-box-containing protein
MNAPGSDGTKEKDRLQTAIAGMVFTIIFLFVFLSLRKESNIDLPILPWFVPFIGSLNSLIFFSVAILAIGRHSVLRDPASFWIGMGAISCGIAFIFHMLSWPGLLPNGEAIIGTFPGTTAWFVQLGITILSFFLLLSSTLNIPQKDDLPSRWLAFSTIFWILFLLIGIVLLIQGEQYLPFLVEPDGTFKTSLLAWNAVLAILFALGAVISTCRYFKSDDNLLGYMVVWQIGFAISIFATLVGTRRYDLLWYLTRILPTCTSVFVLFGLLIENVRRMRHEKEKNEQVARTLEQLRVSESRFEALVSSSSEVLYRMSPDWSEMRQLTGGGFLADTEKPNLNWLQEYIHPDDQSHVTAVINEAIHTRSPFKLEHRVVRADGTPGWTLSRAVPLIGAAGEIIEWFGAANDITGRKQESEALRTKTAELSEAQRVAHIGNWNWDPQADIITLSDEGLRIFGLDPKCQPMPSFTELQESCFPVDDWERLNNAMQIALNTGQSFTLDLRAIRNGEIIWVAARGEAMRDTYDKIVGLRGTIQDITYRKHAEEKLCESERRIRVFFESDMLGMLFWDMDGNITDANEKFLQMVGYSREDFISGGISWWQMSPLEYRFLDEFALNELKNTGIDTPYEKEFIRRDGSRIPILIGAAMLDQKRHEGVAFVLDITAQKRAEQELKKINETLEQKVADRTKVAEDRAAQLQSLAIELLEAEDRERRRISELLHEDLQQILAAARMQLQMKRLPEASDLMLENVERLLEHSVEKLRKLSHELSPTVLQHTDIVSALEWLAAYMAEHSGLFVELQGNPKVNADMSAKIFVFRAVRELLYNVAKHSNVKQARINISSTKNNFRVIVCDSGKGFNSAILDDVVAKKGLGLLSLRERANHMGGRLDIESSPDHGSCISLTIPTSLLEKRKTFQ